MLPPLILLRDHWIENHDGVDMIVHRLRSHKVPQHKTLRWPEPWGMTGKIAKVLKEVRPHGGPYSVSLDGWQVCLAGRSEAATEGNSNESRYA